jgi:hypothetical protein
VKLAPLAVCRAALLVSAAIANAAEDAAEEEESNLVVM